ncbi:MAG TPA: hypothetical protein VF656_10010 [Pyrinomonadaceae bacterium]
MDPSRYRLYDLRYTCATLLLRGNIHPKFVSERLGHSSITITLDVYSHCVPTMQETATEKIGNMIYGAIETPDRHPPVSAVELDLTDEATC